MKSDLNIKIRENRLMYHLKQKEMAELLDLTINQISTYERGTSNPNFDFVFKLAKYFNRSIEDFTNIPMREEFFVDAVIRQEPMELTVHLTPKEQEIFSVTAGLIPIELKDYTSIGIIPETAEVATNFILLKSKFGKGITDFFEAEFERLPVQSNDDSFLAQIPLPLEEKQRLISGYPLLVELYQRFNRRSWLGNALSWPTKGKNIVALQLPNNKIIRLYISSIATGCQLYAVYNSKLEGYIKAWESLSEEERISMSLKYYLNLHKTKTLQEDADEQDIASKKAIYDKILGTGENDTEN